MVAELEHTEAAVVTASGMAALTAAVLALVSAGDHVIGQKSTYGGTASVLLNLLPRLGVSTSVVDQLTMADNTFATPVNQRPADFGIDLVWHSATKYLNGHTDVSLPGDLPRFYRLLLGVHDQLLGRPATRSHWGALYRPLLGLLSVAAVRLTGRQLRDFGEIPLDQAGVDVALARLQFFLDGDPGTGFHLHHLSTAEYLADEQTPRTDPRLFCDPQDWHGQITRHAIQRQQQEAIWPDADPYLKAHLPTHAAECGRLDDLVEDPRYLLTADPDALVPELGAVGRAEPIARVYQQVVPLIRDGDLAGAQAHLKLYAEQARLTGFAACGPPARVRSMPGTSRPASGTDERRPGCASKACSAPGARGPSIPSDTRAAISTCCRTASRSWPQTAWPKPIRRWCFSLARSIPRR